jgi:ssDNA thymidine ADP-ribosyltransferase, DarT
MLYTIHRGNVESYSEGQRPILHLVTTVEEMRALGLQFAFTDGHAVMALSEFYDDLNLLPTVVDWEIMGSRYWHDTNEDLDRKRRRQAEFLVHQSLPWPGIRQIGVIDANMKRDVETLLMKASHKPDVVVKRDWYY